MFLALSALPLYLLGLWRQPFIYAGCAVQAAYLVMRGFQLERLPLVGPHDTLTMLAASIAGFSLPLKKYLDVLPSYNRWAAAAVSAFTIFSLIAKQHNTALPPVLKTFWFELHVVLAFLAYALFGIGAILGALYLKNKANIIEGLQYRYIFTGYCLFSLSMIFGGIWAFLAWGTYWLWTPKELWTTILWLFYSLYLHVRLKQELSGAVSALIGIAGFFVTLFTYLGVSLLMKSSHTF